MKRKVSIQKGFVFGVTAVAVLAIAIGVVIRFTTISADVAQVSNADSVTDCYVPDPYYPTRCYEKYVAACTRTEKYATKAEATPTAQEKLSYGDKVKAYDIGINNGNANAKFRMTVSARRTGTTGPVRFDVSLTPKMINWGGNGDNIALIFPDGLGYKKSYNYITKGTTWSSYINKEITTGNINILFSGRHEDGCIKSVIDIRAALATPTPAPSSTPSIRPSVSASPSGTPTIDPNLLSGLKGCYYNGKAFQTLKTNRNENINFIWGPGPASIVSDANNFSARWEGYIIPKYTEAYTFKLNYDDAARVWIGGRQYINDWTDGGLRNKVTSAIQMQAGVAVPIKVEYYDNTGSAEIQLSWKSARQSEQPIPAANLKHTKEYTCAPGSGAAIPSSTPSGTISRTPTPVPTVTVSAQSSIAPVSPTPTITASNTNGLNVKLEASTLNLTAGKSTRLRATYSSVAGKKILKFYCDANSTQILDQYSQETMANPKVSEHACTYTKEGTYTAKVYFAVGSKNTSATATIKVNPGGTISAVPVSPIPIEPATSIDATRLHEGVKADYFKGQTLTDDNLLVSKLEKNIYFNWGSLAPATGVSPSNFSSRFTGKILAPATGDYSLGVLHNDGVRVWMGGKLIIDQWIDWNPNGSKCADKAKCDLAKQTYRSSAKVHLEAGRYYDLKIEHYDKDGKAALKVYWKRPSSSKGEMLNQAVLFTSYNPNPPQGTGNGLIADFYQGINFEKLILHKKDKQVNYSWGSNGPTAKLKNNFSVRLQGEIQPRFTEKYTLMATADDGVRVWIDGKQVINNWNDVTTEAQTYSAKVDLVAGKKYPIKIEMYEKTGKAKLLLRWKSASETANIIPSTAFYSADAVSPTPTVSPSASVSVSVSPNPSPSPSVSPVNEITKVFQPGFTAVYVPDNELPYLTGALSEAGMSFYRYGPLVYQLDPLTNTYKKAWDTSAQKFSHKVGYYVKNPGTNPVTVTFKLSSEPETAEDSMVFKGWNLLANTSSTPKKLSDLVYEKKICTDEAAEVNCDGYSATVNFGNVSYGWKGQGKSAYTIIYLLNDLRATDETPNPFTTINVLDKGIGNVEVPANTLFWFYFFD